LAILDLAHIDRVGEHARLAPQPFRGYEDIGAFFLLTASLNLILRLLAYAFPLAGRDH
jgi:hypothetical protein